jgi:phosphoglycolate phosphatase
VASVQHCPAAIAMASKYHKRQKSDLYMQVKLIIFDFDGTLASSIEGITVCMGEALHRFGYRRPSQDKVRATIGLTLEDSIRKLTKWACPESDIPLVVRTYRNLYDIEGERLTTLFDGAAETLAAVKAASIKTVLVSNKGNAALARLLQQLEIVNYFDLTLSADCVQHHKPSGALYDAHIAPIFPHIHPKDILVVGDTESDLRFAANIGAHSCWAAYGYGDAAACSVLMPAFTISSATDLRDVLGC